MPAVTDTTSAEPTYNLADLWEMVVDHDGVAGREALVCGGRRYSYADLEERANRLANHLASVGVGPGDFVGCYLPNHEAYIDTLLACFKIRAVPVNVNYRYVTDELRHLFNDAGLVAVVCPADYVSRVAAVAADVPTLRHTLVVGAATAGVDLGGVPDGVDYDAALAAAPASRPVVAGRGGDDLYVIYTGGTTGLPKGVVWRIEDAFFGCIGGGDPLRMSGNVERPGEILERIVDFDLTFYALAPMMHAAAQWVSMMWLLCGAKVILHVGSFDAVEIWRTVEAEKVSMMTTVGDAMARPLADAWDEFGPFEVASLYSLSNGGAPLNAVTKQRLQSALPNAMFTDGFGSSETGIQGSARLAPGEQAGDRVRFNHMSEGTLVLDGEDNEVEPGSGVVGRVATTGYIPLRYHNAPEKTAETFVEIDGRRYVLSGDMAVVEDDGSVVLLGRGSVCINTGGEKVYPEEVEAVVKSHPDVYDAVVVGVPNERWGEQVTAVVRPTPGAEVTLDALAEHCRASLASYKVPRDLIVVESIERSPAGKADYRWAKQVATR